MYKLPKQLYENWNKKNALEKYLPSDINRIIFEYAYEPINLIEYDLDEEEPGISWRHSRREAHITFYTKIPIHQILFNLKDENYLKRITEKSVQLLHDHHYIKVNKFNPTEILITHCIYNRFKHFGKRMQQDNESNIVNNRIEDRLDEYDDDEDLNDSTSWTDGSIIDFKIVGDIKNTKLRAVDRKVELNRFYCHKDIENNLI